MVQEIFIEGIIENVVYTNPENGYSVIDLSSDGNLITAVGTVPSCSAGEKIKLRGVWVNHPTFGKQFKASACERSMRPEANARRVNSPGSAMRQPAASSSVMMRC